MAAEVTKIPQLRVPAAPSPLTPDQRYWASFSSQQLLPVPNSAPITHLSTNSPAFSLPTNTSLYSLTPAASYIAVTTGPRLQLLSPRTLKVERTIARTSSAFHGTDIRRDGRVVLTGSESGSIQAFDTSSRAILKTWTEHKQPVWVTKWHPRNLTSCMSASDDTTVRAWDLPAESSVWTGYGHEDYVRTGTFIGEGHLMATGSYDQSIRIWDSRVSGKKSCVMNFALSAPVEAVLALPGGTQLVGAAGPSIAVLDLVGARPLHLLQNHQKTVTSLAISSQGSRLLSGALDGHVKIFNTDDWTVVAGFKHASPVLSLSVIGAGPNKEDRHLCVGMQSGLLSIRTRLSGSAKAVVKAKEAEMAALVAGDIEAYDQKKRKAETKKRGAGWEKRIRGKDYTGEGADIVVADGGRSGTRPSKGESGWETALRRGRYGDALDQALKVGDRLTVMTCVMALVHRSAVRKALEGRNTMTLTPIIRFITKNLTDAKFVRLLSDMAIVLVDLYGEHMGQNDDFDMMMDSLHTEAAVGVEIAQMCISASGMLEILQTDPR